jgi:hypothetical protein
MDHPDPQGYCSVWCTLFFCTCFKNVIPCLSYSNIWNHYRTLLPSTRYFTYAIPPVSIIITNHFAESYPIHHVSVGNSDPTSRTPGYLRNRRIFNPISHRKSPRKCHLASKTFLYYLLISSRLVQIQVRNSDGSWYAHFLVSTMYIYFWREILVYARHSTVQPFIYPAWYHRILSALEIQTKPYRLFTECVFSSYF